MKKILILMIMGVFMMCGCSGESLKISDLEGYWVDEYIYKYNEGIDKVIEFTKDDKMIVSSYYDKGTTVYKCEVKNSSPDSITFTLDNDKETVELEKVKKYKYKYKIDNEVLFIVRVDEKEAVEFLNVIEENAEY